MFTLPEEELFVDIEGEIDVFVAKMMGKKHYEKLGCVVLKGDDFENDMLLGITKGVERRYLDRYIRMKVGRAKNTDFVDRYYEAVSPIISNRDIEILLYLCRFCSYLGGPGFPDLLVTSQGRWFLRHPKQDLTDPYKIYIMLASLLGYDAKLLNVKTRTEQNNEKIVIDEKEFIERLLDENKHIWASLEEAIEREKEQLEKLESSEKERAICEDTVLYLEHQKHAMPFYILLKWLDGIRPEDIRKAVKTLKEESVEDLQAIQKIVNLLKYDDEYQRLGVARDESTLRKKAEHFQRTYLICEARAKDVLNFLM